MARPTKYTLARISAILLGLESGLSRSAAAAKAELGHLVYNRA